MEGCVAMESECGGGDGRVSISREPSATGWAGTYADTEGAGACIKTRHVHVK
jgi:hypothetical protein